MSDHPYDRLESLAFGDLSVDEQASLLAHADACPVCAAMLADAMRGVAAMARADGERGGSEGFDRVLGALGRAPAQRPTALAWFAGISAAAAVLLALWDAALLRTVPAVPIAAMVHSHFTHHPLTGPGGAAKMLQSLDGSWVYVIADGLTPGASYEFDVNGSSMGQLRSDARGQASAYYTRPPGAIRSARLFGASGSDLRWP